MRKDFFSLCTFACLHICTYAQIIPFGTSLDSLVITTPPNTVLFEGAYYIHYYKSSSYNPVNSPVMFAIHGLGSNGNSPINDLQTIADRRNALIVAPDMHTWTQLGFAYATEGIQDTVSGCAFTMWMPEVLKQIYMHVLQRENRTNIPAYLISFSAGGQFTTRYMLMRQFAPDSIPIRMAVSVNPANYTLMTDTFNTTKMSWYPYRCGLEGWQYMKWNCTPIDTPLVSSFICNANQGLN